MLQFVVYLVLHGFGQLHHKKLGYSFYIIKVYISSTLHLQSVICILFYIECFIILNHSACFIILTNLFTCFYISIGFYLTTAKISNIADICKRLYVKPQLLPPYLYAITSLIGSLPKGFGKVPQRVWEVFPKGLGDFPNGFGEVCCQATEFYTLSSGSFGDEDCKSQCMPVANHKHAI